MQEGEGELLKVQMGARKVQEIGKAMLAKGYAMEEVMALPGLGKSVVGRLKKAGS